jgi:hypothetical protein
MEPISRNIFISKINAFLFAFPEKIDGIVISKIISIVCLINIALIRSDVYELYGQNGLVGSKMPDPFIRNYTPKLSWVIDLFGLVNIGEKSAFFILIAIYIMSLVLILMNYKRFFFSIVAFLIQLMTITSSFLFTHGGDSLTTFILFVNILICSKEIIANRQAYATIYSFSIRLVQIHLCLIYFFSGFGKILGTDWFDGNAIWFVINTYSSGIAVHLTGYGMLMKLSGWIVLTIELLYPALIFARQLRPVTLLLIILMHIFIGTVMGLQAFAIIMVAYNIIAWSGYFSRPALYMQLRARLKPIN